MAASPVVVMAAAAAIAHKAGGTDCAAMAIVRGVTTAGLTVRVARTAADPVVRAGFSGVMTVVLLVVRVVMNGVRAVISVAMMVVLLVVRAGFSGVMTVVLLVVRVVMNGVTVVISVARVVISARARMTAGSVVMIVVPVNVARVVTSGVMIATGAVNAVIRGATVATIGAMIVVARDATATGVREVTRGVKVATRGVTAAMSVVTVVISVVTVVISLAKVVISARMTADSVVKIEDHVSVGSSAVTTVRAAMIAVVSGVRARPPVRAVFNVVTAMSAVRSADRTAGMIAGTGVTVIETGDRAASPIVTSGRCRPGRRFPTRSPSMSSTRGSGLSCCPWRGPSQKRWVGTW